MDELLGALLTAILEPLLAVLGYFLLSLVVYIVFLPFSYVLFTPFILLAACFGSGSYRQKLSAYYRSVPGAVLQNWGVGPIW